MQCVINMNPIKYWKVIRFKIKSWDFSLEICATIVFANAICRQYNFYTSRILCEISVFSFDAIPKRWRNDGKLTGGITRTTKKKKQTQIRRKVKKEVRSERNERNRYVNYASITLCKCVNLFWIGNARADVHHHVWLRSASLYLPIRAALRVVIHSKHISWKWWLAGRPSFLCSYFFACIIIILPKMWNKSSGPLQQQQQQHYWNEARIERNRHFSYTIINFTFIMIESRDQPAIVGVCAR